MSNFASHPPSIIFVDSGISQGVLTVLERQLFSTETMTGTEFDQRLAADPNYPEIIKLNNLRIIVVRPFDDYTNRQIADFAVFIKYGLLTIEDLKNGPPAFTIPVDRIYLSKLYFNQ